MGKHELWGKISGFISSKKAKAVWGVVALALIVAVGILVAIASSSKSGNNEVVFGNKEEVVAQAEESLVNEELAQAENDTNELADETEEVADTEEDDEEVLDYAAVFIVSINPKVKIYVDADGIVLKMEKMNADADVLLEDLEWANKKLEDCFNTLLVKAHEEGFLKENAKVSITVAEAKEDVNVSSMTQEMEKVTEETCKDIKIDIKLTLKMDDTEETMEKEIIGNTTDAALEDTILSDNTEEQTTVEEKTEEVSKDDSKKEDSSASNNKDNGNSGSSTNTPSNPPVVQNEYSLVWEDNFDGEELNRNDWNVELHDPGWVNAEWQAYVDSEENIYIKDSKLVLQAIEKIDENGNKSYTSGRVNTQDKHDFKYGKFEAKIKVPSGMGFLPAFWMMPTDEQFYGQWPKCGEIDIMEVMGQSTDTLHGTIHYGEPHGQKQGTYVLDDSIADFAEEFHVYTCEWEPGKITWYVDGIKFHEATDWYTKKEGFDEVAYPAPFDQPFYMILNVAVGGSWVGYPDETTQFGDNAQMQVDYVRVYQKNSYDENVEKPEKAEVPDSAIGENLLTNGDFATAESMSDENGWEFLTADGGVGSAQVVSVDGNNALKIATENAGNVDYSIQIVQGPIALKQGNTYKVSFDAWADDARKIKALISAPDFNYARYWGDQTVNLTTTKQTYSYEFDMTEEGDANSRFEMTFGNMGSTATVYIDNVKVEKTGSFEVVEDAKSVLPDGNYIYNSGFDTGADRMKYWTVDSKISGVSYCATNIDGVREFKAVVPRTVTSLEDVVLKQEGTVIAGGKEYLFTFDAYGAEEKTIKAVISPESTSAVEDFVYDIDITTASCGYSFVFAMPEGVTGADVKFLIGTAGTTYIDNVRVQENANVINGNFSSGIAGWELYEYTDGGAEAEFVIDELDNGSGTATAAINIANSGTVDWHIQFKQNVKLEQGKRYRISFDAWSPSGRDFVFAIQRNADAKKDNDWTSYSGDINEALSKEGFKHYYKEFNMTWETDDIAQIKFTLGAVGGKVIDTPHTVFIDNVLLEEIGTCEIPGGTDEPTIVEGENMFLNPNFDGMNGWAVTWDSQWENPGTANATTKIENNTLIYDITNVGNFDYSIQLKQEGLDFEEGTTYRASFNVSSSVARDIKFALMGAGDVWYAGKDVIPVTTEVSTVSFEFKPLDGKESYEDLAFQLSLGKVGESAPASTLTFANMKLVKLETQQPEAQPVNVTISDINLIKTKDANGDAVTDGNNIAIGEWNGADSNENGVLKKTVNDPGEHQYSVQLQQFGINLEANCEYKLTFKGSADVEKLIQIGLQENGEDWTVYSLIDGQNIGAKLGTEEKSFTIVFTMNADGDDNTTLFFNLGNVTISNAGTIIEADGQGQENPDEGGDTPSTPETPSTPVEGNMFERGSFNAEDIAYVEGGTNIWNFWTAYKSHNSASLSKENAYNDGCMTVSIENEGEVNYGIQLGYLPSITLENGASYIVIFDVNSSVDREVEVLFQDSNYTPVASKTSDVVAGETTRVTYNFTFEGADGNYSFLVNMGKINGADSIGAHTISFDNFSLVKVADAPEQVVMTLRRPVTEEVTSEEATTEDTSTEEDSIVEESTEEPSTEDPTQEPSGEEAIVETKSEEEEEVEE